MTVNEWLGLIISTLLMWALFGSICLLGFGYYLSCRECSKMTLRTLFCDDLYCQECEKNRLNRWPWRS